MLQAAEKHNQLRTEAQKNHGRFYDTLMGTYQVCLEDYYNQKDFCLNQII